jgi:CspA family cold shock protein
MKMGTVKWFNLQKGYGFIHPDDGTPNIHVDMSAVKSAGMSDLKEGQRVSFESQRDERTGSTSLVALEGLVLPERPRLDRRFAATNSFDIIYSFISSARLPRLRRIKRVGQGLELRDRAPNRQGDLTDAVHARTADKTSVLDPGCAFGGA